MVWLLILFLLSRHRRCNQGNRSLVKVLTVKDSNSSQMGDNNSHKEGRDFKGNLANQDSQGKEHKDLTINRLII